MSNLNKRIAALEGNHNNSDRDSLIEQIIEIWATIGETLTQAEAEALADGYLEQGITKLTWEMIMRRNPEDTQTIWE